jgi:hypothetical protein
VAGQLTLTIHSSSHPGLPFELIGETENSTVDVSDMCQIIQAPVLMTMEPSLSMDTLIKAFTHDIESTMKSATDAANDLMT